MAEPIFHNKESESYKVTINGLEKTFYHNRAVTMNIIQLIKEAKGEWQVLIAERGPESFDYKGLLNLPCGHLDWDETIEEGATRELYEETGFYNPNLRIIHISSNPNNNRQNVEITLFSKIILKKEESLPSLRSTLESMHPHWASLNQIVTEFQEKGLQTDKWAFRHDELIAVLTKNL